MKDESIQFYSAALTSDSIHIAMMNAASRSRMACGSGMRQTVETENQSDNNQQEICCQSRTKGFTPERLRAMQYGFVHARGSSGAACYAGPPVSGQA